MTRPQRTAALVAVLTLLLIIIVTVLRNGTAW
jgi:hypothetical protein